MGSASSPGVPLLLPSRACCDSTGLKEDTQRRAGVCVLRAWPRLPAGSECLWFHREGSRRQQRSASGAHCCLTAVCLSSRSGCWTWS